MHNLNLTDVHSSFVGQCKLTLIKNLDSLINARSINDVLRARLVGHRSELIIFLVEVTERIDISCVILVLVQVPRIDEAIPTSGDESGVVIKPFDASNTTIVSLVLQIGIVFTSVELINVNLV